MAKLRIGPFSEVHFSKLEQRLSEAGVAFSRFEDPSFLESYNQKMKQRSGLHETIYPVYSGTAPEFLFIELEKADIFAIRQDLNDLGYSLNENEGQFDEEYHCTKCDFRADTQQRCPKHNILLVTYREWIDEKNKPTSSTRLISILMVIVFLSFIVVAIISD
jgi:hypothetical protein